MGQKAILLSLVETMDLIHEQHEFAREHLGAGDHLSDVLNAGCNSREHFEMGVAILRHHSGEGCLACSRWSPQHHRMNPPGKQRLTEGRSLPYQLALAHEFVKGLRPHRLGKRSVVFRCLVWVHSSGIVSTQSRFAGQQSA